MTEKEKTIAALARAVIRALDKERNYSARVYARAIIELAERDPREKEEVEE